MQRQPKGSSLTQHKWLILSSLLIAIVGSLVFSASLPKTYSSIKQISINSSDDRIEKRANRMNMELDLPTISESNVTTEPELVKMLLASNRLRKQMGKQKVTTRTGKTYTLQDYLLGEKEPWWNNGGKRPALSDKLQDCMMTEVNLHNGIISIKGVAQDPCVACQITQIAARLLSETLQQYTRRIAVINAAELRKLRDLQRSNYQKALRQYASVVDANAEPMLMTERSRIDSLQKNIDVALEAYNKANMQYQLAHMKESRQKIYFITINNEAVTATPTHPRTFVNLMIWMMYALLFDFWTISLSQKYKQRTHGKQ